MVPYLIQRGKFRNIPDSEIVGLDSLVSYDYMGSAEFEFGTLFKSLSWVCENWPSYVVRRIDKIQDIEGSLLYFVAPKILNVRDEDVTPEDLEPIIKKLFSEKHPFRLKEYSECYERVHGSSWSDRIPETNFWWDVDHHWMICFGKDIKRLILALQRACQKNGLPMEGGPTVEDEIFQMPVFEMDASANRVTVTDFSGNRTIISLNNLLEVIEDPEKVSVLVLNKAGIQRYLHILVQPSAKRDYLVKMLKERLERNKRKQ